MTPNAQQDELPIEELQAMLAAEGAPSLKKIKATVRTDDVTGDIKLSYVTPEPAPEKPEKVSYFQHRLDTYENE